MDKTPEIVKIVETMFKYRGTNYSQVSSLLKTKNGKPMSRQVLYRMVNNGTISLAMLMEIADILNFDLKIKDRELTVSDLENVHGDRVKKKLKGVVYDTDKMFSVGVKRVDEHRTDEVCLEPVTGEYIVIHYGDDKAKGKKKFPHIEKIQREEILKVLGEKG